MTDADLSLPWLSHQSCQIAGRWLQLVRVSFAGELGWELHTKVEDTAACSTRCGRPARSTG